MTTPIYAIVPASFESASATLIAANGTAAKVLVDQYEAAAVTSTAPQFAGGCSVIDITAASTDASPKTLMLYHGAVLTTAGDATGAVTTTASTVVRATGSFIADGWRPGGLLMTFAESGLASNAYDGVIGIVTAVADATLTVHGTPFGAGSVVAGSRICRVSPVFGSAVAAGSGNGSVASASLMDNPGDGSALRAERKLGANELLAVAVTGAVSALPAYISVLAQVARY